MPLPTLETCDIPTDACCRTFYDVADELLTAAHDALVDCVGDTCENFPKYVSTGEPSFTDEGEYLAVWIQGMSLAPGARGNAARPSFQRPVVTYGFKLVEKGWPTLESGNVTLMVPDAERMHALSLHAYSHIERIIRAQLQTSAVSGTACQGVRLATLNTLPRTSGLIGWQWALTAEMSF